MEGNSIATASIVSLAALSVGTFAYLLLSARRSARVLETLASAPSGTSAVRSLQGRLHEKEAAEEFEYLKEGTRQLVEFRADRTQNDPLFQAGFFSERERQLFRLFRVALPLALATLALPFGYSHGPLFLILFCGLGFVIGLLIPTSHLNKTIANRSEDIMYFLPLVVEQLVIGVSSSLDIGPCVREVVNMADERDSHNPVTELLRYAQQYVKSGVSLDEALMEVGLLSGHTELKHTFMALSQVTRHGGEITKQLQELANSVAQQREARIEGRIRKLELEATLPVGLVFLAFLSVLLVGLGTQVVLVFK